MKIRMRGESKGAQVSSAMTDISFLLIIFFLLSAIFVADSGLLLALPPHDQKPIELEPKEVVQIEIAPTGECTVNGRSSAGTLTSTLRALFRGNPELVTIIETAPGVRYRRVIEVLETAKAAGGTTFSIIAARGPVPVRIEDEGER